MSLFEGSEPWLEGYLHQRPDLGSEGPQGTSMITAGGLVPAAVFVCLFVSSGLGFLHFVTREERRGRGRRRRRRTIHHNVGDRDL